MWSRGALHSFCIWCILFEVERGFLPDELLFLFAFLCQNAWCGTLVVEPCLPFALMWWVAFCLQDQLHPFCYSVVMTLFSSLALNWLVLRGTGHDAWLSSMACFRLIFRAWCRQKISTQKPSMVTCFFFRAVRLKSSWTFQRLEIFGCFGCCLQIWWSAKKNGCYQIVTQNDQFSQKRLLQGFLWWDT